MAELLAPMVGFLVSLAELFRLLLQVVEVGSRVVWAKTVDLVAELVTMKTAPHTPVELVSLGKDMMAPLVQGNKTTLNGVVAEAQVELQVLVHLVRVVQD
jgi:hypothetical protein